MKLLLIGLLLSFNALSSDYSSMDISSLIYSLKKQKFKIIDALKKIAKPTIVSASNSSEWSLKGAKALSFVLIFYL